MAEVRYLKAVNQALHDAMQVDDSVSVSYTHLTLPTILLV